jgi:hypothetical protein
MRWFGQRTAAALVAYGALAPAAAAADDDEVFRLDPVFVSVFRVDDRDDEPIARAIERRVATRLGERHLVVPIDEVRAFEDYSAEVYLRSCQRDRISGCAYVIGERAGADWAVDGFVEPLPGQPGVALVETTIVDIRRSRTVVTFQIRLDGANDAAWADAVATLIDRLSAEGDPTDLRDLSVAEVEAREARLRAFEREAVAASLEPLTADLATGAVRDLGVAVRPVRVTAADVEAWRRAESAPPWERVGLGPREYRFYRNSGLDLASFRDRLAGRAGRAIVRGALGGGYAPGRISYDARWAVDPATTDIVGFEQTLAVLGGGGFGGELELGVGLLPWLDVSAGFSSRGGRHDWLVHSESTERPREPRARTVTTGAEREVLGRVTVAPFPLLSARPIATFAIGAWAGPPVARFIDFSTVPTLAPPDPPRAVRGRLGIGGEIDASPRVQLFARAEWIAAIAGGGIDRVQTGDPARIAFRDDRLLRAGRGGTVAVGVSGRTGRLVGGPRKPRPALPPDGESG